MRDSEIRLECLRLAVVNPNLGDVLAEAGRYAEFVLGAGDVDSDMTMLEEVLDYAFVREMRECVPLEKIAERTREYLKQIEDFLALYMDQQEARRTFTRVRMICGDKPLAEQIEIAIWRCDFIRLQRSAELQFIITREGGMWELGVSANGKYLLSFRATSFVKTLQEIEDQREYFNTMGADF